MEDQDPELMGAEIADAIQTMIPSLPAFAEFSREYFKKLKEQKFETKEALYLTAKFIESMICSGNK